MFVQTAGIIWTQFPPLSLVSANMAPTALKNHGLQNGLDFKIARVEL